MCDVHPTCHTYVIQHSQTDGDGVALIPKGLNVYPRWQESMREVPFFSSQLNAMCYPFIFPYGTVDFENSTIGLVRNAEQMTEEELQVAI